MAVQTSRHGVSLLLMLVAIILIVVAALGVDFKIGVNLFELGVAFGFASFIF